MECPRALARLSIITKEIHGLTFGAFASSSMVLLMDSLFCSAAILIVWVPTKMAKKKVSLENMTLKEPFNRK